MSFNAQLFWSLILLVILPNAVFWYSPDRLTSKDVFQYILLLPVVTSIIMAYVSHIHKLMAWLIISITLSIITAFLFYTVHSLSSFGF